VEHDDDTPPPRSAPTLFDGPLFDSFDGWARVLRGVSAPDAPNEAPTDTSESTSATAAANAAAGTALGAPVHSAPGAPEPAAGPAPAEAEPWRPRARVPMALLRIVDDGRDDGETIRLRGDSIDIGRVTAGVAIPHDAFLEEAHARLDRLPGGGWLLTDLGSRDGTWVRVASARLRPGTSLRAGSTTLTLRADEAGGGFLVAGPRGTRPLPCPVAPFLVGRADAWPKGAAPHGMPLVALDDPHVSPIHAEVILRRGTLRVVNHGLNGLWVRIDAPVRLLSTSQFQCGEQRFVLEPLLPPPAGG